MAMGIPPQLMTEKLFSEQEKRIILNRSTTIYACLHVDSFFAQAESNRLGLDSSAPLASTEQGICVSLNYPAFNSGVQKGMTVDQAKALCSNIVLVEVNTMKILDNPMSQVSADREEKLKIINAGKDRPAIEFYRAEWDRIISVLRQKCSIVEKISSDEAFLDITAEAYDFFRKGSYAVEWKGMLAGGQAFVPETEQDVLLMIGTQVMERMRRELKGIVNYTCCVGISFNKTLARAASTLNKPNGLCTILSKYCLEALKPIEVSQLSSFGRQVIDTLATAGCRTIEDVQRLSMKELAKIFKSENSAKWVYSRSRGIDEEAIEENDLRNKSVIYQKSFGRVYDAAKLDETIDHIVGDFCDKIGKFYDQYKVVPSFLSVRYHDNILDTFFIKSATVNLKKRKENFHQPIKQKTMDILKSVMDVILPCSQIGLIAKNFEKNELDSYTFDLVSYTKNKKREKEDERIKKEKETLSQECSQNTLLLSGSQEELSRNTTSSSNSMGIPKFMMKCVHCSELIPGDSMDSHNDFHIAEGLDKQLNPNKRKYKGAYSQDGDLKGEGDKRQDIVAIELKKVKKTVTKISKKKVVIPPAVTLDRFFGKK